jgi:peroxiredoxin
VKGKIGQLNAPAKVYLRYAVQQEARIDSINLISGRFQFSGKIDTPVPASLFLSLDGNPIKWPYDELMIYLDTVPFFVASVNSMHKAKTSGSRINDELQVYDSMMAFVREGTDIDNNFIETNRQFVLQYPGSLISVNAIKYMSNVAETVQAFDSLLHLFSGLDADLQNSPKGQELFQSLDKKRKLLPGMTAPDFIQPDSTGRQLSLSSLRGHYVLIDFWASWCKPCRADNKELVKIFDRYRNKNFKVLGVSVDTKRGLWLKAIKDDQLPWLQVSDLLRNNEAAELYQITGVPTSYLLDPDGVIIARNLRGKALETKLEQVLNAVNHMGQH